MDSNQIPNLNFRKTIGAIAIVVIVVHLLLCLIITFSPSGKIANTKLGRRYNHYVLLGPFFSDNRIKHAVHLSVRSQSDGAWTSYVDLSDTYFKEYLRQPWNLQNLVLRDYARKVGADFSANAGTKTFENFKNAYSFKRLNNFISSQVEAFEKKDSVQVLYIMRWSKPYHKDIRYDTVFNITYSPVSVESSH